ncbi:MAG: histidinol dehydrogenase, partial [Oscillospiraceae bacterium]|nr:histidinol dehydrogenase [Oscillospiraceae bacterium]
MITIYEYGKIDNKTIFARTEPKMDVAGIVADIIRTVREEGDEALRRYTRQFDGAELSSLEVSEAEFAAAMEQVEPEFLRILETAAGKIRRFHEQQKRTNFVLSEDSGAVLGQRVIPIERVGLYVPGGTAAYPSTVLMDSIPAKIAGCGQIVMVTPPGKDGTVAPAILAAAKVAGVERVFKVGGAQAVAALAYGTETVPGVDKIVGPGNAFVAEAKKQVFGMVSI